MADEGNARSLWFAAAGAGVVCVLGAVAVFGFVAGRTGVGTERSTSGEAVAPPTSPPTPRSDATADPGSCGLDAINLAALSVVRLETNRSTGSGFLLADGTLVTNAHVLGSARVADVQFADGSLGRADVVGVSDTLDLATLQPTRRPKPAGLTWGDSASLRGSQSVVAIGFPLGFDGPPVLTKGSVSRLVAVNGAQYVQTDSAINPGNSGGPLVDECGRVVGVVTLGIRDAEGLGFAQAASAVRPEIESLIARPRTPVPSQQTPTPTHAAATPTSTAVPPSPGRVVVPLLQTWHSDFLDYLNTITDTGNDILDRRAFAEGSRAMRQLQDALTAYANTISASEYAWYQYSLVCRSAREDMIAAFNSLATAANINATMFAVWPNNAQAYNAEMSSVSQAALTSAGAALDKIVPCGRS